MELLNLLALLLAVSVALLFPPLLNAHYRRLDDRRYRRRLLVVNSLRGGPLTGAELQEILRAKGLGMSGPAFYAMMAKMEGAWLKASYEYTEASGQPIKERWYRWESVLSNDRQ